MRRVGLILAIVIAMTTTATMVEARTESELDSVARANYRHARTQLLKEISFYQNAKSQLVTANNRLMNYKSVANKNIVDNRARVFLIRATTVLVRKLESIKVWVSDRSVIEETQRQEIVAGLDSDINALNQKLAILGSARPEEVKNQAEQLRDYWRNSRGSAKRIAGRVLSGRIEVLSSKAEDFSARVAQRVELLAAAGRDTSEIETRLADVDQKIWLAKEKLKTAKVKFAAISNLSNANSRFIEGHQHIKEAHQFIRSAHSDLVAIVKEMKKTT